MTVSYRRRWFRDPLVLLALAAGLIAFVVQSGELGSADTTHRLQTAHAWWTGEPEVFPNEFPEFGVHGRGGKLQSWYSLGQSVILLPPDVVGTYVARLPIFAQYDDTDPSVRDIIVSYTINILVTVLTALVCFRFLRQLNFGVTQSVVGVLALLLATTHLHYTQNMMENNYIFLLTMTGLSYQFEWLRSGRRRPLLIGSAAFGLNLLTRLPTGLDLLAGALFLLLVLWFEGTRGQALWELLQNLHRDRSPRLPLLSDFSTAFIRSTALGSDQFLLPMSASSPAKPRCGILRCLPTIPSRLPGTSDSSERSSLRRNRSFSSILCSFS